MKGDELDMRAMLGMTGIQRAGKADISTTTGATPGGEPGQSGQGEHKQGAENIEGRQDAEPVDPENKQA